MKKTFLCTLLFSLFFSNTVCNSEVITDDQSFEAVDLDVPSSEVDFITENEIGLTEDFSLENRDLSLNFYDEKPSTLIKGRHDPFLLKAFNAVKGQPSRDGVGLGMWSYHFWNRKGKNEVHDLFGIQLSGVTFATFRNSYSDRAYFLTASRDVYRKQLFIKDLELELGYKVGLVYGYGDRYPNVAGLSPIFLLTPGISYKFIGATIYYVPAAQAIAWGLRLNLDGITSKMRHQKPKHKAVAHEK